MLPTFVHTLTVAGKVLICHFHPREHEKAYLVQILNDALGNTKFLIQCNEVGIWRITSEVAGYIREAQHRFTAVIEEHLGEMSI